MFYKRSNVEIREASKFPVSKCRFHLRTRGKVSYSVVSSCRLALRVSLGLVYSFNLAVDSSNDFMSSEVFQPNGSVRFVLCELHAFSLSRKLHVY